jgi:hypothetical protein
MMHLDGDTMIFRGNGSRNVVIIRDSANGHSNVIINGGTVVGRGERVRVQTHTLADGDGDGGTVIVNGDTLARGGSSHVVIITRSNGENAPAIRERRRVETEVRTKPAPATPSNLGYTLEDAVPNPFDQRAQITFTLPTSARVSLNVFNESGEVIRKLVDQEMSAGKHTVDFDGTGLPTGVYLYQLVSGSYSETKSMRLVR